MDPAAMTGPVHFAPTAWQLIHHLQPQEHPMSPDQTFDLGSEVTVTITGKVVYTDPRIRTVVIEYSRANDFPARIAAHIDAPTTTVVHAPPPTAEEQARRDRAAKLIADSAL
jgi:hypothetical protein